MTDRNGRKISAFPALSSLPGDAVLNFISGGVNYQITLADFESSLNVTGSIVQDGDPTGVPVLDVQGAVNNIRNVEPGAGISASVSAQNGLTIKHNLQAGSGGQHLLTGIANASPMIGDIIAGTNITLSAEAGGVKVSNTKVPPLPANVVLVSSMSDFPAAVAGVRTLAADTYYYILANLSTSDRFDVSNGNITIASYLYEITYTGSGNMFTGVDASFALFDVAINTALGRVFSMSDSVGVSLLNIQNVTINNCDKIGLIAGSNYGEIRIAGLKVVNAITDGIDFGTATVGKFSIKESTIKASAGSVLKLGTAVFSDFNANLLNLNLNGAGVYFLSGAASSANIASGSLGVVSQVKTIGAGTPLNTITVRDNRWQFVANSKIQDTKPSALISLSGNAAATLISGAGTPVKVTVGGNWDDQIRSQFTMATNGRVTYTGEKDFVGSISVSASAYPSAGTKTLRIYVAINGAAVAGSKVIASATNPTQSAFSTTWQRVFSNGDYVELWVDNLTDTTSVVVTDAVIRVG